MRDDIIAKGKTTEHDSVVDHMNAGMNCERDRSMVESSGQPSLLKRFFRGEIGGWYYAVVILVGVIGVAFTSHFINLSTVLDFWDSHPDTYLRWYGRRSPTVGQYWAFGIAAFFNVIAMLCVYLSIRTWVTMVRPVERGDSPVAKAFAVFLFVGVYLGLAMFCFTCKRHGTMSVWDYGIFVAICRLIWLGVVGKRPRSEVGKKYFGEINIKAAKSSSRRFVIKRQKSGGES